ncbi:hypothetical protein [Chromobacterium violaceum]|uniref:Uncharacterized protein n=1 Tax=Chromobacterium violaceum TaxID=536 RepID=A0A2R4K2L3_CHRVL|nr:hypothetical protein [Chromobacterium violaceum]AVV48117.1 hypothetical protein [Chromobacterium violaceum]MCD0490856.1 hypothetical protein [Chromobacterium violaceum]QRO35484.1 hypothetical protein I6K04_22675 [Chromobacterium violaceum]QRQ19359.1 hypothetical protein I6K03_22715 [Chromobacterium violaceum]
MSERSNAVPSPAFHHDERWRGLEQRLATTEATLAEVVRQRDTQQKTLDELNATLHDLRDLLEAWETTRGAFNLLRALGHVARWMFTVGVAVAAVWLWLKSSFK